MGVYKPRQIFPEEITPIEEVCLEAGMILEGHGGIHCPTDEEKIGYSVEDHLRTVSINDEGWLENKTRRDEGRMY